MRKQYDEVVHVHAIERGIGIRQVRISVVYSGKGYVLILPRYRRRGIDQHFESLEGQRVDKRLRVQPGLVLRVAEHKVYETAVVDR